jgi:rhomboid protease GluP
VFRATPVTRTLIIANVLIFAMMLPEWKSIFGPSDATLVRWGADYGPLTMNGQYWRLISSTFIHFDLGHIFFNMLALLSLGHIAERAFSRVTYLVVYFGAGLCGSLASQFFHPNDICVGASAAIFGLAGLLLPPLAMHRLSISPKLLTRPLWNVALFAIYNLGYGALHPQIDNAAHVGGFIFGVLLGVVFSLRPGSLRTNFISSLTTTDSAELVKTGDN